MGLTVEFNSNGSITVYCLIDGKLVQKTYYGYHENEAVSAFTAEFLNEEVEG